MKKKLVSALLCATMAASLLAGCGSGVQNHPRPATQEALARKAMQKLK